MRKSLIVGTATLALSIVNTAVLSADAVMAKQRIEVSESAQSVWEKIGDFCAIEQWHAAVVNCEISEEGGDTYRTLTLPDGATIKEKHLGAGSTDTSYKYAIIESPLPVKDYVATFEVSVDDDGGAGIKWSADFMAEGVADNDAKDVIDGIFTAGMDGIKALY